MKINLPTIARRRGSCLSSLRRVLSPKRKHQPCAVRIDVSALRGRVASWTHDRVECPPRAKRHQVCAAEHLLKHVTDGDDISLHMQRGLAGVSTPILEQFQRIMKSVVKGNGGVALVKFRQK